MEAANTTYFVYIHKAYFPAELTNKFVAGKEDFEQWHVNAASREEAAKSVWKQHGDRLLKLMRPNETRLPRKVSLYVSSPKTKAGRLPSILVYSGRD